MRNDAKRYPLPIYSLLLFLSLLLLWQHAGFCQEQSSFSFCVLGDTRSEPFLPGGIADRSSIEKVLKWRYQDRATVEFDSLTGLVNRVRLAPKHEQPPATLFYRDGTPFLMTVELEGTPRIIMRRSGTQWLYRRVADALQRGIADPSSGPLFLIHTGDIVLWDKQGKSFEENPDWQEFSDAFLRLLPWPAKGDGPVGRVWPVVGNHEIWGDDDATGLREVFPHLASVGLTKEKRDYSFFYQGCRFIFLDSGGYDEGGNGWAPSRPSFDEQMKDLKAWLNQAVEEKARHVFITYHKPSYCTTGHGSLRADRNPNRIIEPYADKLDITVFNGHVHTTEAFQIKGVRYLVLGAGGAPQVLSRGERNGLNELYWKGQPRQEEYNYLTVKVNGRHLHFTMHRFRPGQTEKPIELVELFSSN